MLWNNFTNPFLKVPCIKNYKSSVCHGVQMNTLLGHLLLTGETKMILVVFLNIKYNGKPLLCLNCFDSPQTILSLIPMKHTVTELVVLAETGLPHS